MFACVIFIAALLVPAFQTPTDAIQIKVTFEGFEPSRVDIKGGKPVKLAFYRPDSKNCGEVIEFPALHLKRDLPAGKTTVIELPAMQKGTLRFGCGMGMMKGSLVVSEDGK
jgi:plastocyanin domain-containing protein